VPAYSAHPNAHHPFMPWPAEQIPVFIPAGGHPDAFLGHNGEGLVRTESHNSSIDSRDSGINAGGKKSNSRGRKSSITKVNTLTALSILNIHLQYVRYM